MVLCSSTTPRSHLRAAAAGVGDANRALGRFLSETTHGVDVWSSQWGCDGLGGERRKEDGRFPKRREALWPTCSAAAMANHERHITGGELRAETQDIHHGLAGPKGPRAAGQPLSAGTVGSPHFLAASSCPASPSLAHARPAEPATSQGLRPRRRLQSESRCGSSQNPLAPPLRQL